jgi:hypothetical protein
MKQIPQNLSRIEELQEKINNLKNQIPKHSILPSMIIELEELEDELSVILKEMGSKGHLDA